MDIAKRNQERRESILVDVKRNGVNKTARRYGVNPYYISNINSKPDYIPRSPIVCEKLDLVYYKAIDPTKKPRNLNRCHVYPTTSPAKITADLLRVTGQRWAPVEGELEY